MASGARRIPLSFRTTPELYERMRAASMASGRSMTQEVEIRLEASFAQDGLAVALERIEAKLDALTAGRRTR
jgi:hypothetical protein